MRVENEAELRALFDGSDADMESLLLETGFFKPLSLLSMSDKDGILSSVTDYHCILKVKAVMDQFLEGLEVGGVLVAVRNHGDVMKSMFCPTQKSELTAGLQSSFHEV